MSHLDKHFGVDASLENKATQEISAYLLRNGASSRSFASHEDPPRVTSSDWFASKHRGAIRLWSKGRVKSLADCAACHQGAGQTPPKE